MSRIIEFAHPGKQINLSKRCKNNGIDFKFLCNNSGVRYWNDCKSHFRKFICQPGQYLKDLSFQPENGHLLFWGEWEPQSDFILTGGKYKCHFDPHAIHIPFLNMSQVGYQNTDPFVFGKDFYYSNCEQSRNKMKFLNQGDLILFGTEYKQGFALDTVFVVDSQIKANVYLGNKNFVPTILSQITLDLNNLYKKNSTLVLYKAKMFNNKQNNEIFSFVPCMPKNRGPFQRPMLNFKKYCLKNHSVKRRVIEDIKYEGKANDYWHLMVDDIINQGYYLGIQIDLPTIKTNAIPTLKKGKNNGCYINIL